MGDRVRFKTYLNTWRKTVKSDEDIINATTSQNSQKSSTTITTLSSENLDSTSIGSSTPVVIFQF